MLEVTCSTTLFTVGALPMVFVLAKNNENEIVTQMIQHGGGCIASSRGPYSICLTSPKYVVLSRNDVVFSTDFIKDCCMANRILDINQYRLGHPSSCPDNFDAMKVLLRQSHWPNFAERDEKDSADTDRHSDSDTSMESQNSRRNIGSQQSRTFSGKEEEEILHYIVENKAIGLIQGNTLWKKIAQKKVQGRTWQSLKKHFLKHVLLLRNITKYKFLSVMDRLEFQKHLQETPENVDGGSSSNVVSQRQLEELRSNRLPSLHKMGESGDGGSSSKLVSQRQQEEHRTNRLPSPSESSASNVGSILERDCGRRLPENRKLFRSFRGHESSDSDSVNDSHPRNTDDQRLKHVHQFNRSTSSQVHRENKDKSHPRKEDDPQHPQKSKPRITQRQQSVINSTDEVESGNEEHYKAPVVQRTTEEKRKSSYSSSTDNDWFMATGQEQHSGNTNNTRYMSQKTRKKRREEFTMEEEYAILQYLKKHNWFNSTGGNNVWKNMAATGSLGKRHTWQSLRERYLKKIVPNINKYNLPEEIKRRVKRK